MKIHIEGLYFSARRRVHVHFWRKKQLQTSETHFTGMLKECGMSHHGRKKSLTICNGQNKT